MNFLESFRESLANLNRHKLRTILTMLGMIFGVGAVIAMLSIGAGGEREALEMISRLGLDNVIIRAKQIEPEMRDEIRKNSLGVSMRDAEAISQALDEVSGVLPRVGVETWRIGSENGRAQGKVFGVSWRQPETSTVDLAAGRFIDRRDEDSHAQVAVVGAEIARDLFGDDPPVGKLVKVNDIWFQVIGVQAPPAGTSEEIEGVAIASPSREILIPASTALRKFARDPLEAPVDEIIVRLEPGSSATRAAAAMQPLISRLHGGVDDFEIVVPEALLEQSRSTQRIFNVVMGSIAGISLLVGGIGIMNIMLATVLERTREIGVRRAIGATRKDIQRQFVIESFSISLLGGLTGILAGIIIAQLVAASAGWPTVITPASILLSTGVSISVGVISGIYPANRAAKLDPIEALRYE